MKKSDTFPLSLTQLDKIIRIVNT